MLASFAHGTHLLCSPQTKDRPNTAKAFNGWRIFHLSLNSQWVQHQGSLRRCSFEMRFNAHQSKTMQNKQRRVSHDGGYYWENSFHVLSYSIGILIVWYCVHVLGKWSHVPFLNFCACDLETWSMRGPGLMKVLELWNMANPTLFWRLDPVEHLVNCYLSNQCVWICPFMKERLTKHVWKTMRQGLVPLDLMKCVFVPCLSGFESAIKRRSLIF